MPGVPLAPNEGDGNIRDRTEREFEVVVHLGKEPGSFSPEVVDLGTDPTSGRSLIKIPRNTSLGFETSFGKIEAIENGHEEMAAFAFRCLAAGWPDALRKYSEMVAPIIDQMAFANDVPIFVRSIAWKDAANRTWGASYTAPYRHVVPGGEVQFEHELRPLYALYREALSSGSVFYQFLCLSKILEGSFRSILPKLRAEAKARGLPTPKVDDKVDPSEHIHGGARQWIGHGIEQTFNDYLQKEFRNALAHFAADGEDPLILSNYFAGARVADSLFLVRACARKVIDRLGVIVREMKVSIHGPSQPIYSGKPNIGD